MDAAAVALFTLFDLFVLAWNVCALSFSAPRKRSFAELTRYGVRSHPKHRVMYNTVNTLPLINSQPSFTMPKLCGPFKNLQALIYRLSRFATTPGIYPVNSLLTLLLQHTPLDLVVG
jgi:hypothetical protein